MNELDLDFVWY